MPENAFAIDAKLCKHDSNVSDEKAISLKCAQKCLESAYSAQTTSDGTKDRYVKPVEGNKETIKSGIQHELDAHVRKRGTDGVTMLDTGDFLVRDEGRQILFMTNGDKLTINKDGSYDLKNLSGVRVSARDGVTTLKYDNGDVVQFDSEGPLSICRGNQGIFFGREQSLLPRRHHGESSGGVGKLPEKGSNPDGSMPHNRRSDGSSHGESLPNLLNKAPEYKKLPEFKKYN